MNNKNLARKIKEQFRTVLTSMLPSRHIAWLGWADGTLVPTGRPNYVCCTTEDKQEIEAWNDGVPLKHGIQVDLYTDPDYPGLLRAKQPWIAFTSDFPYVAIKFHNDNHTWPGPDTVAVEMRQFMPLHPSVSGFVLTVRAGWMETTTGLTLFGPETVDLISHKPSNGARYALVSIGADGVLAITDGTVKTVFTLGKSDIPALPAGHTRVCAVRLYAGQTSIKDQSTSTDLLDLRFTGFGMDGLKADWDNITNIPDDLTDIAGLSPANDDVLQRKSGTWTSRTMAQLSSDIQGLLAIAWGQISGAPASYPPSAHTHPQSESHNSPDTDGSPTALHHTLGTGANQAAAGNHAHAGVYEPANANIQSHISNTSNPHAVTKAQVGLSSVDNVSAASLRDRSTHTGTQLAATISDFASAVRAVALTGLSTATNAAITAADTVLSALGKLQAQITGLSSVYAPIAKGVTNGDSHDHNGGDGAQINHTSLSNIGTNTHAQIDSHIAASNPHSGSQPLDADLTAIAGLSPANDDIIQRKSGAWTNRTIAQLWADLQSTAKTYFDSLYSALGHTHTYASLTDKPQAETQTNALYQCDPAGISAFAGTIATLPGGATLTYNVSSGNENALVPASTSNLAKLRLYNTTRGNYALISNSVAGTNTITLTANVPAGWTVGDTITIASQTVSGGGFSWVDLQITSGPVNKTQMFLYTIFLASVAGDSIRLHPHETFGASKYFTPNYAQVAGVFNSTFGFQKIVSNVFTAAWTANASSIYIREAGYLE